MTGDQLNPSSSKLDIAKTCESMGAWVRSFNPMEYKSSVDLITEAKEVKGVKVLIAKYPCALSREFKNRGEAPKLAVIVEENCTGCKLCITPVGCPALSMKEGTKLAQIDPALCTGCNYCAEHCRFDAIKLIDIE